MIAFFFERTLDVGIFAESAKRTEKKGVMEVRDGLEIRICKIRTTLRHRGRSWKIWVEIPLSCSCSSIEYRTYHPPFELLFPTQCRDNCDSPKSIEY
jgi:hypothetical protein